MHLRSTLIKLSAKFYLISAVLWTILTLYLSLISAREASKFNVWDFVGFDKLAHLIFYCIFCFLWCMGFRESNNSQKKILFFSVSFGVLMEICQLYLFNGRSFELFDIIANIIGSVVGLILFKKIIN
ncbi:MAG: VanZ family protein [Saprospiraceae bacterium]|nr:VanZ family protein [Saprospiraceae bacterium]MBL0026171.1 VanZ family protein [Saprospiraceae bacterium]